MKKSQRKQKLPCELIPMGEPNLILPRSKLIVDSIHTAHRYPSSPPPPAEIGGNRWTRRQQRDRLRSASMNCSNGKREEMLLSYDVCAPVMPKVAKPITLAKPASNRFQSRFCRARSMGILYELSLVHRHPNSLSLHIKSQADSYKQPNNALYIELWSMKSTIGSLYSHVHLHSIVIVAPRRADW